MHDCKHVPAAGKVMAVHGDHCSLPTVRVLQLLLGVTTRGYLGSKVVPVCSGMLFAQQRCWTVPLWHGCRAEGQPAWLSQVPTPRTRG